MDDARLSGYSSYHELMSSPDLLPIGLEDRGERICFVPMSRESYRASTFLDFRAVRRSRDSYLLSISELLDLYRSSPASKHPHYIMHGAFCCSTLLTRYLDLIAPLFVLREPDILRQVLLLKYPPVSLADVPPGQDMPYSWETLLRLSVRLLSRTYHAGQAPLIKCNDLCNYLAEALLGLDGRSKLIFVSAKLRVFLLAVLKSSDRRRWVRSRLNSAVRMSALAASIVGEKNGTALSDPQAAALVWLSNVYLCRSLLRNMGERIRVLDGDDVADRPREALSSVADFLDAPLPDDLLEKVLGHESGSKHAKYLLMPFDAEQRAKNSSEADARFGVEADAGVEWAMKVGSEWISDSPFQLT
jgi:hypothetical protein